MLLDIWRLLTERHEFFLKLIWEHLWISFLSIIIAAAFGGAAGILISEFKRWRKPAFGVINFLYTVPSISMLGFLIPFSGIGNKTAVIALIIYALLPMVRSTYTGLINVDKNLLEAARGMGSTKFQILFKIKLPLALPVIMSGIRSMVTMTIALGGIAAFIGAGGLGVAIYRGITTNNAAMTILGSLFIAVLALLSDSVLGLFERRLKNHSFEKGASKRRISIIGGMIAVGILIAFLSGIRKKDSIHIATKPMTEQYILGEMLKLMIEQETDIEVILVQGVGGGTSNIHPAMVKGEFDLYPEYTGTGWNMVLKHEELYAETMFDRMQAEYQEELDFKWVGNYGFKNTYGLAVRSEIAEKYQLRTYSDLRRAAAQLTFGAEYDFFERSDGYDSLCQAYGLVFKDTVDLDIGLKYQAVQEGRIDVMNVFTTDGQLSVSDVVVLEDDKGFYPSYLCGNVIRMDTLENYPELETILEQLDGILSDGLMAQMNYQVEAEGKEPKAAAEEILHSAGLLR